MSQGNDVQALLKQGIEAARQGNKEAARGLFERVVELDEKNDKGWYWLATVVDTDEEKRICLRNVLHIDPGNERAQKALDKLDIREKNLVGDAEVVAGVSRRQFTLVLGGGVVAILVIIAVFLVVSTNTRNRQLADQTATQVVYAGYTATVNQQATEAEQLVQATQTAFASITPTATIYTPARTEVPTWTPTATATEFGADQVVLPMPQGLSGTIAGWSGRDVQGVSFLPVGAYDLVNGAFHSAGDKLGRDVDISPDGQRLIFTRYDEFLFGTLLWAVNLNSTQPESINERFRGFLAVLNPEMPHYGHDGNWVVFAATDQKVVTTQLYLLNLTVGTGINPVRRLTDDKATYTYPAISPDGQSVVAVKDDKLSANPGPDLVVIDVATLEQRSLTSDLGTFVETTPRWSPDGSQIIYAAASANDPKNFDIAFRGADGSGAPFLPVRSPANDIYPIYSPDGRYIAFSSNRNGPYDIYIYDVATSTLSQLTNTPEEDYPGAWWVP